MTFAREGRKSIVFRRGGMSVEERSAIRGVLLRDPVCRRAALKSGGGQLGLCWPRYFSRLSEPQKWECHQLQY